MSNFRDLIARMAIDAEFARHARTNPNAVARHYGLSPDESEQLRGLADAAASGGPTALGARLSKMGGLISSALVDTLHVPAEPISHGLAIDTAVVHLNPHPTAPSGDPVPSGYPGDMFGDNDGDGIPNFLDPTPDGDPHPKFTNVHVGVLGPVINLGGDTGDTGDPAPPPADGADPAPPTDGGDATSPTDGGHQAAPPGDHLHEGPPPVVGDLPEPDAAIAQPIMLADDALNKPVPQGHQGIGEEAFIVGGAAFAGGAIAGGVAGVVLNRPRSRDEE